MRNDSRNIGKARRRMGAVVETPSIYLDMSAEENLKQQYLILDLPSYDGTITFTNTAASLDAITVGRLFDRFYTVDAGRNSTGLGLSIAKLLTERMNGSIEATYESQQLHIIVKL